MKKFILSLLYLTAGFAGSFDVIQGTADFYQEENKQIITNSDGAYLHWQDFSIASEQTVHFAQDHAKSVVFNKVIGSHKSLIDGVLSSNGRVFLINSNGIHVSQNALVETAGFVASTLDISLNDEGYFFHDPGMGEIINEGVIQSSNGDIIFLANEIKNTGSVKGHFIGLVADKEVLIKPNDTKHIYVKTNSFKAYESSYQTAIHAGGTLAANQFEQKNGRIFLIAKEGTSEVNGLIEAPSGDVRILGKEVMLRDNAHIDVSGNEGGSVLIGGDFRGQNPDVLNAKITKVSEGAKIKANALGNSSGGRVIFWSDDCTVFSGLTEAKGGEKCLTSGFVEISSKKDLHFTGKVDLKAKNGIAGSLFLDPKNAYIQSGGADPATGNTFAANSSSDVFIDGGALSTAIDSAHVTIQANTDIFIDDDISATASGNGLTMQAGRSIQLSYDRNITLNNANLTMTINDPGAVMSDRDSGTAVLSLLGSESQIATQGGNVAFSVGNFGGDTVGEISIYDTELDAGGGNIDISGFARKDGTNYVYGVCLMGGSEIKTTGAGTISITGSSGTGANNNIGVILMGDLALVETDMGNITLTGTGGGSGSGDYNKGVDISSSTVSSNSGTISVIGQGGSGNNWNVGCSIYGSEINNTSGSISFDGTGSGSQNFNMGTVIGSGTTVNSSSGASIDIQGTSSDAVKNNHGVMIQGEVLIDSGTLSINGVGQGSSDFNYGVRFENGTITSNTATIDVVGDSQGTAQCEVGICISGSSSNVSSNEGDITMTGTSSGTLSLNQGIRLEGSQIVSTGEGMSAANILLNGTGGPGVDFNNGVYVAGDLAKVSSVDGDITINATGMGSGKGNNGVYLRPSDCVYSTGDGEVTINSN